MDLCDARLVPALAAFAERRVASFSSQDLASAAWIFASVNLGSKSLFNTLAAAATQRVGNYNSRDLSSSAWAFAKVSRLPPQLGRTLSRRLWCAGALHDILGPLAAGEHVVLRGPCRCQK
eukprot:gnl/TRDRNA2_/TRDRNA2_161447_c2_seq1.p1 gnl/TRDRNA2_/TRDRNA2_161447_c2~~gnl/TRDRNA2_/TRDRNA2_161447_c2_seq1.p1  ORF type:complete len:120 (+),score=12.25 gnl/TRDRNA2_/TRDRNA2_161447_c2_seq1:397-756(+)